MALYDQGRFNEAVESYQKAVTIKPDIADAYYNLGNALRNEGGLDAPIDSYQQTIKIKPDLAEARNNIVFPLQASKL